MKFFHTFFVLFFVPLTPNMEKDFYRLLKRIAAQ